MTRSATLRKTTTTASTARKQEVVEISVVAVRSPCKCLPASDLLVKAAGNIKRRRIHAMQPYWP